MAEAIVIALFFSLLVVMQYREQKEIKFVIRNKRSRKVGALLLGAGLLAFFWPVTTADQLKLVVVSLLVTSIGFVKEGLGESRLIKVGYLDAPYSSFHGFWIDEAKGNHSFVTLYKGKKNNSVSFFLEEQPAMIRAFFEEQGLRQELGEPIIKIEKKSNKLKVG